MVERATDRGVPFRKWPVALRKLWQSEQESRRRRELAFINLLGFFSCLICLPLDHSIGPQMFEKGLVLRLGLLAPAYLVAICAALFGGWALQRWTSVLAAASFAGVAGYLGMHGEAVQQNEYVMGSALLIIVAAVVVPLRPGSIVAMVVLSLGALWAAWAALPPPAMREAFALIAYLSATGLLALAIPFRTTALKDRTFLYALRGRLASERLVEVNEQLRELSHRDDLTGLPNRRYFERIFHTAFRMAEERRDDLAVMMIDVDRFKQFNDTHGHSAGDRALRQVATELEKQFTASGNTVARYGGEEFVVVVEGCSEKSAMNLADRARRAVAQRPVVLDPGGRVLVTVSIGVALRAGAAETPGALLECADQALYAAKNDGRNLVRLACSERPAHAAPAQQQRQA